MAITTIGGSINSTAVLSNLDYKYGPYSSLEEAYIALGPGGLDKLVLGLTVGIIEDGAITEYWFKEGTTLNDLVKKSEGLSAYEIAKKDGYQGTEEEWLASLKGDKGDTPPNPFKGWFPDFPTLKSTFTASPGDYAYVHDDSPATTTSIYIYSSLASSDMYWADSGENVDTSNISTFESGEQISQVSIIDDLTTGGDSDVLSAEQGRALSLQNALLECSTEASTAAKIISVTGFTIPTSGGSIKVNFTNANTAASGVTLNINSTGAKAILYNGAAVSAANSWSAGDVVELYYDPSYNSNAGAWFGRSMDVDVNPTANSSKLVTSGGVYDKAIINSPAIIGGNLPIGAQISSGYYYGVSSIIPVSNAESDYNTTENKIDISNYVSVKIVALGYTGTGSDNRA